MELKIFLCVLSGLHKLSAWKMTEKYKTPGENCVKMVGWSIATSWPSTMGIFTFRHTNACVMICHVAASWLKFTPAFLVWLPGCPQQPFPWSYAWRRQMGTTYLRIVSWHGVCYSDYQDSLRHWKELECLFLMIYTDIHCTFLPKTSC